MKALITYGWCRSSYVALKSLHNLGLEVYIADQNNVGMCQWSKYSKKNFVYRSPFTDEDAFIEDINRILKETQAKFLLPSHDETVILAKHRDKLPVDVILPIDDYEKLVFANDKYQMAEFANKIGVSVPLVIKYNNTGELKRLLDKEMKYVVKTRKGNGSKGVFYPSDLTDVILTVENIVRDFNLSVNRFPVVQERIVGDGWGVSCIYWKGERVSSFTHKRLEEKILKGGTSTLRVSKQNPILEDYAHNILDKLKWHGLAMVEFKYNEQSKEGWFIEVNPRLWGSISLAAASGIDFPGLLYTAATKGKDGALQYLDNKIFKENIVARWLIGDVIRKILLLKKGNLLQFFKEFKFRANIYDDLSFTDLRSSLGQASYYIFNLIKYRSTNPTNKEMLD